MVPLMDLWLAVLLAAVAVFVVSSVIHMCTGMHKNDHAALPDEEAILDALRTRELKPGLYMFPYCKDMKELGTPEGMARYERGPVGFMQIRPSGPPTMGKALLHWFLYCVLVSVFVAYVAGLALGPGASCSRIVQITGTVALLGYGVGSITESIWKGVSWGVTAKFVIDGLFYAAATAAIFCWLWP